MKVHFISPETEEVPSLVHVSGPWAIGWLVSPCWSVVTTYTAVYSNPVDSVLCRVEINDVGGNESRGFYAPDVDYLTELFDAFLLNEPLISAFLR